MIQNASRSSLRTLIERVGSPGSQALLCPVDDPASVFGVAVRVLGPCRELGYPTVAVYSEPDRAALRVLYADQAIPIGPAPSRESYLRVDRILDAAKRTGAEAIHPGYGFLAENAVFARACRDAGILFIGPSPESIEAMGSKTQSRQRMQAAGVPFLPGLTEPVRCFAH